MKKTWLIIIIFVTGLMLATSIYFNKPQNNSYSPTTLRVAVLPDQSISALQGKYAPLLAYLSEYLQIETKLIIPGSYQDLVKQFDQDKVDLAYLGGLTFLQANTNSQAKALVMREADTRFSSWFVVKGESNINKIEQLADKPFTFGSNLSTSGHLMPRHYLTTEYQIDPENFFKQVNYSGGHDQTIYDIRDGIVSAGAVNSIVYTQMLLENRISADEIKVIWKSPPYPDYVWAVQAHLNEDITNLLRNAFLSLSQNDSKQKKVLNKLGASYFLPATAKDFNILKGVAIKQKLLVTNK